MPTDYVVSGPELAYNSNGNTAGGLGGNFNTNYVAQNNSSTSNVRLESIPPVLRPNRKYTIIDVVKDFYWTYSKKGEPARLEVPSIFLSEKRLKTNSVIAQIKSSFGASVEGISNIVNYLNVNTPLGNVSSSFTSFLTRIASTNIAQSVGQQIGNLGQSVSNSRIAEDIKNYTTDDNPRLNDDLLRAYKDLYLTEPTGFNYRLPYFEDYYNASNVTFGDDAPLNIFSPTRAKLVTAADVIGSLQSSFGFSFQERAKFYNFDQNGEEFVINFPLINTGSATFEDVIKNWQFLFLLLYQNKPSRINRTVIEPPVIYEAEIPGQKFIPFCYISEMVVTFKGARRKLKFNLPQGPNSLFVTPTSDSPTPYMPNNQNVGSQVNYTSSTIEAIIPDAYQVKITLRSLLSETKNFLAYTYKLKSQTNKITVRESASSGGSGETSLADSFASGSTDLITSTTLNPQNTTSSEVLNNSPTRLPNYTGITV